MAAQGAAEPEGTLEVDGIARGQASESSARKRFRTELEEKARRAPLDDREAHAVDRDAAAQVDPVEGHARLDLQPGDLRPLLDRADRADLLHDPGEHQLFRGPRTTSASTSRSSPSGVTVKPPRRTAFLSSRPAPPTTGVAPRPPISSGAANIATRSTRPASRNAPWISPPP